MDAIEGGREPEVCNITYYLLRAFLHEDPAQTQARLAEIQAFEAEGGITSIDVPGKIDVNAQIFEPRRPDPRAPRPAPARARPRAPRESDAVIVNIDYPLGMAAYHHLSRLGQGTGEVRGLYIMGKAATLNGRVGDVMISTVVQDEHSRNTYLFRNCFAAADVQPYLARHRLRPAEGPHRARRLPAEPRLHGRLLPRGLHRPRDGGRPLPLRHLRARQPPAPPQRRDRPPLRNSPFDVGILHYASDTPYSRRQSLLSKSLSYFGVESTYACAIAIVRRILAHEVARTAGGPCVRAASPTP
jgi:hypothetical protein